MTILLYHTFLVLSRPFFKKIFIFLILTIPVECGIIVYERR
nr:MAG TPA: hypothetical protein [Caudoviricetes sp.]